MNLEQLYDKYKKLPVKRNFSGKEALKAVKKNGLALLHVKDQTEDICLAAVKKDGHALLHVKNQTEDICLAAVKQNGNALQYIKDQTEDICIAAVEECENALQYVNESIFEEMISKLDKTLMLVSPSKHIRKLGKKI